MSEPPSGTIATAFPAATQAGADIFRAGGNAIDAAVAAAWALSVCEPAGSGLGGQTILLIRLTTGRIIVVDGHSYAPAAVSRRTVRPAQQHRGYRATTVPSTPATLGDAQSRYGILSRQQVMEPAIRLASEGYHITPLQHRQLRRHRRFLRASPQTARLFLKEGKPFAVGEVFRQLELAGTLRRLAESGIEDFYRGAIAREIAADMHAHDGLLTLEDLEACRLPVEREPVRGRYRGYEAVSTPSPSGGEQLLRALTLLEQRELIPQAPRGTWYHAIAEVILAVFREREGSRSSFVEEPGETTHLCAADRQGNVVALTQSIQTHFGAGVAHPSCGFLYNNYLTTCPRHRHPHRLRSRCQPRSNAAPMLILHSDAQPYLALGAAGSRRITSAIVQVLSALIDRGLPLAKAIALPRVHATLNSQLWLERCGILKRLAARLTGDYRKVVTKKRFSDSLGVVQALQFVEGLPSIAAADPRRDGSVSVITIP